MKRTPLKRSRGKGPNAAEKRYWDSLDGPCQGCGGPGTVIHHVLAEAPGKRRRRDHMLVNRLCAYCHNSTSHSVHMLGSEAAFKRLTGVDLVAIAVRNRDEWLERQNG